MIKTELRKVKTPLGEIEYTLERKQVKNLNLRVRKDGSVYVSAGRMWPVAKIDEFVAGRAAKILGFREREERQVQSVFPAAYASGQPFWLLGREKVLQVELSGTEGAFLQEETLLLQVKAVERAEKRFASFVDETCTAVFGKSLLGQYPFFEKQGIALPQMRLRLMKSRWGSCHTEKGIITLNKRLLSAPPECIDYVVLHELCHLIRPDHSAAFHGLMTHLMPDWKQRKKRLEAAVR